MAFDVAVAGSGIVGSSIAWRLAQAGLRVALVDAGRMGGEASWAAAGMLAPGGEIDAPSPWTCFALDSLRAYPAFVAELESESGVRIDFQRRGAIEVAATTDEMAALDARATLQTPLGIPSAPLSPEQVWGEVPCASRDIAGGRFYPEDALVDPRDLMSSLRAACAARGVEIREGMRVAAIRPASGAVEIVTEKGVLTVGTAVLAAGAWSSLIPVEGFSILRAFPVRGHLMRFQVDPGVLGPILRRGHTYLLQRSSGYLVAGASSEECGFDRTLDPEVLSGIHRHASELLPMLGGRVPHESWLGFRPGIEGDRPVIERVGGTALWLAYGHYRNGILLAPATAARVAAAITASWGTDSSAPTGRR